MNNDLRTDLDTCDRCGEEVEDYLLERVEEHEWKWLCEKCREKLRIQTSKNGGT